MSDTSLLSRIKPIKQTYMRAFKAATEKRGASEEMAQLTPDWRPVVSSILAYMAMGKELSDDAIKKESRRAAERLLNALIDLGNLPMLLSLSNESQWLSLATLAMAPGDEEKFLPAAIAQSAEMITDRAIEENPDTLKTLSKEDLWGVLQQSIIGELNQTSERRPEVLVTLLESEESIIQHIQDMLADFEARGISDNTELLSALHQHLKEALQAIRKRKEKEKNISNLLSWKGMLTQTPKARGGFIGSIAVIASIVVESITAGLSLGVLGLVTASIVGGKLTEKESPENQLLHPKDLHNPPEEHNKPLTKKVLQSVLKELDKDELKKISLKDSKEETKQEVLNAKEKSKNTHQR